MRKSYDVTNKDRSDSVSDFTRNDGERETLGNRSLLVPQLKVRQVSKDGTESEALGFLMQNKTRKTGRAI